MIVSRSLDLRQAYWRPGATSAHFDCFEPASAVSIRVFTLGFEALCFSGLAFFGRPLLSFTVVTFHVPGHSIRSRPSK